VRAGLHDLLDPEKGYSPDAQIELGAVSLRHYQQRNQTRLERVTLANIVSLSPLESLFLAPSWKVNAGMETVSRPGCRLCSSGNLNGGLGGAVESHLWRREVLFAFAEADANVSGAYREQHRIGGGGTLGALATLTDFEFNRRYDDSQAVFYVQAFF
ncbi:MAG: hypothetical protein HY205_02170, partial [Nitrospirae bacterium]|nr:hypothetical protein [Nitrospirota bacterium]